MATDKEKQLAGLKEDFVTKHKYADEERLFYGSAKQYLDSKGQDDLDGQFKLFNQALKNHNDTDRYSNLINKIKHYLLSVQQEVDKIILHKEPELIESEKDEENNIIIDSFYKIRESLKENLDKLRKNLRTDLDTKEPSFKKDFIAVVKENKLFNDKKIDKNKVGNIAADLTGESSYDRANYTLRSDLYNELWDEYLMLIQDEVNNTLSNSESKIIKSFKDSIKFDSDEVNESINDFLKDINKAEPYESNFEKLISRFSRNVFDVIIMHPHGSETRKNVFKKYKYEFLYLNSLYVENKQNNKDKDNESKDDETKNKKVMPYELVEKILDAPRNLQDDDRIGRMKKVLRDIFNTTVGDVAKSATKNFLGGIGETLTKTMSTVVQKTNILAFDIVYDKLFQSNEAIDKLIEELNNSASKTKEHTSDYIVKEINYDIEVLKDALCNAVLDAANIDMVLFLIIDKRIRFIEKEIKNNSNLFKKFMNNVMNIIKEDDFNNIKNKLENSQEISAIIEQARAIDFNVA